MAGSPRLLITVHGIRTFGLWQERLEALVHQADDQIAIVKIDYGYFSSFAFLVPFTRWLATRRIRRLLLAAMLQRPWGRVDIVAHSFGTHLVAHSLRGIDALARRRCRVHTLILAGSVLRPWFPWHMLTDGDEPCVQRVVNDCGTRDAILVLSQFLVLLTGMAGRVGFRGRIGAGLRNRYFAIGHSGYFMTRGRPNDFMAQWWLPLILAAADVPPHDERDAGVTSSLLTWTLGYAEPLKLAGYATVTWLLLMPVLNWYDDSRVGRWAARIDALVDQSQQFSKQHDDESAAILSLAALELQRQHGAGRRVSAENAVRMAFSNRPFAHRMLDVDFEASAAGVTSDGGHIVAGSSDGRIRVWETRAHSAPTTLDLPSKEAVSAVAVEPHGPRAVAGDPAGNVWLINLGALSAGATSLPNCEGAIVSLAWGASGRLVAGTESRKLCVWNMTQPGEPPRLIPLDAIVRSVAISPDGSLVAAAEGEQVRVLTGFGTPAEQTAILPFEGYRVHALALTADATQLAASGAAMVGSQFGGARADAAGTTPIRVFALRSRALSAEMRVDTTVRSIAFSPDGQLAAAGSDGAVRIWAGARPVEPILIEGHSGPVVSVAFDADGKLVTAAAGAPAVRRWSVASSLGAPTVFEGPANPVLGLAFCGPEHRVLALAYPFDSQPILWDFLQTSLTRSPGPLPSRSGVTRAVACTPAQPTLVAVGRGSTIDSSDSGIRLWDLADTTRERATLPGPDGNVAALAFDPTGGWLTSIGEADPRVHAWEIASRLSIVAPENAIEGRPVRIAATPGGRALLAVATDTGSVSVLELVESAREGGSPGRGFRSVARFGSAGGDAGRLVQDLAFSPDGRRLAAARDDGSVVVWEPDRPEAPPGLTLNAGGPAAQAARRVLFSRDGETLFAGRADGSVIEWVLADAVAGFRSLPGPKAQVYSLGIRADGEHIAAGFADGSVRVWKSLAAVIREGCVLVTPALQRPEWNALVAETKVCGSTRQR